MKISGIKKYILLHLVLLVYSFTSVLSKTAAGRSGLSFFLLYGGVLVCLGLYAVLWQGVLKNFPLTVAFANKAIVVVWGILWGWLFFQENITWNKIAGAVIIMAGILIVAGEQHE